MEYNKSEFDRLAKMVAEYEGANGEVTPKVGPAVNCNTGCSGYCSGACSSSCTAACNSYCDGSGKACWQGHYR